MTRPDAVADVARADQLHAVEHAGLAAEVVRRPLGAVPVAVLQALDGDAAVGVMERGDEAGEREQRVRRGTAEVPAVQGAAERAQRDRQLAVAAQGLRERRLPHLPVAVVGDHHHVGAQQLGLGVDDLQQRLAPVLLRALDEHLHVHGWRAVERAQRGQVRDDPRLVVGGPAPVHAAVLDRRRERVGLPPVGRRGLDVVVRVEQHRRAGTGEVREQRRRLAGHVDALDLRRADLAQQLLDQRRGLVQRLARIAVERDRRDRHEALEIGLEAFAVHRDVHRGHDTRPAAWIELPPAQRGFVTIEG